MIAGPSEVLVIAESGTRPTLGMPLRDLLAQAEHDMLSSAILVTDWNRRRVAAHLTNSLPPLTRQLPENV